MTVYALLPDAKIPFHTSAGNLANGYKLFIYDANTTAKATTYTDSTGLSSNTNPIILNARGETAYGVYVASGSYKLVLATSTDTDPPGSPIWSQDAITPINNVSVAESTEWSPLSLTPTYISAVSFSVAGNQTAIMQIGRRLKTTNTAGTVYSTITGSSFGAGITTVTVVNDSGTLDSGLSAVSYGFLAPNNPSAPTNAGLSTVAFDPATDYVAFLDSSTGANARALGQSIFGGRSLYTGSVSGATVVLVASGLSAIAYKMVVIDFDGVSLSGTDNILIQLYDQHTGVITSGYLARFSYMSNGVSPVVTSSSAGFLIATTGAAGTISGSVILSRMNYAAIPGADVWNASGSLYEGGATALGVTSGSITLTSNTPVGALDGMRLICSGANTYDAGKVTVTGYV